MFGSCRILDIVHDGPLSMVYRAYDESLQRPVAIKIVPRDHSADTTNLRRCRAEARLLARFDHPNIVQVYRTGVLPDGLPWIEMAWVDGASLRDRISRHGALPAWEALDVLCQAARGLEAAHAAGVVHRDVKPANVLLGSNGIVRVADFGLATSIGPSTSHNVRDRTTSPDEIVGTPQFMPPEQFELGSQVDDRADVFSFGMTAWCTFAGTKPFGGRSVQELLESGVSLALPELPAFVPEPVDALLQEACAVRPECRPAMGEVAAQLELMRDDVWYTGLA
ncbi:MAG: serine/threonine-protein kinase [Planctomycetota bacterium]